MRTLGHTETQPAREKHTRPGSKPLLKWGGILQKLQLVFVTPPWAAQAHPLRLGPLKCLHPTICASEGLGMETEQRSRPGRAEGRARWRHLQNKYFSKKVLPCFLEA